MTDLVATRLGDQRQADPSTAAPARQSSGRGGRQAGLETDEQQLVVVVLVRITTGKANPFIRGNVRFLHLAEAIPSMCPRRTMLGCAGRDHASTVMSSRGSP